MPGPRDLSNLPIPGGWGLAQMVLHYEGEELVGDPDPFAGSVVVQLRLDAEPDEALERLSARDLVDLRSVFGSLEPLATSAGAPALEFGFADEDGRALQQLVLYGRRGDHAYTVTGTHVRGPRFEAVRQAATHLARALFEG